MVAAALLAVPLGGPVLAQSLFSPAITVNDDAVTWFELDQRIQFMKLLRVPGDPDKLAAEALIEDRLKQQAMDQAGIEIAAEDIKTGIDDFAGRTELSTEDFIKAIGQEGVSQETLRDFVAMNLGWRDYVTSRFLARARPTDEEIDRALGKAGSGGGGVQVLLSEVIIPITPENAVQAQALAEEIAQVTSFADFSEAASRFSASQSRTNGGQMDWLPVRNLPPAMQSVILALGKGEVTSPMSMPQAIALFQMRGVRETTPGTTRYSTIEYATYFIAGGRTPEAQATAARISQVIDTCDDLYGIAKDQPTEVLERQSLPPSKIPRDVALELAKLDPNEISTGLTRSNGQTLVLLMLCGRTPELGKDTTREDVANALTQQRLNAFADSLLAQLRADALIVHK